MAELSQEERIAGGVVTSDRVWGGLNALYFTDRRMISVRRVRTSKVLSTALLTGLIGAGMIMVREAKSMGANLKSETETDREQLDINDLLASKGSRAIDYGDIERITLKKKSFTMGSSDLKVRSSSRKKTFVFRRENFDEVLSLLKELLPDKIEVR